MGGGGGERIGRGRKCPHLTYCILMTFFVTSYWTSLVCSVENSIAHSVGQDSARLVEISNHIVEDCCGKFTFRFKGKNTDD